MFTKSLVIKSLLCTHNYTLAWTNVLIWNRLFVWQQVGRSQKCVLIVVNMFFASVGVCRETSQHPQIWLPPPPPFYVSQQPSKSTQPSVRYQGVAVCVCSRLMLPHTQQTLCKRTSRNLRRTWLLFGWFDPSRLTREREIYQPEGVWG